MDSSCLRLDPAKPSSLGHRADGSCPEYQIHFVVTVDCVFTVSVTVLLIYPKVRKFGMLFQFALFIYDDFVIVFYTFGVINYVNVKMSISKKSVKL